MDTSETLDNPIWWRGVVYALIIPSITICIALAWIWVDDGNLSLDWILIAALLFGWMGMFYVSGFGTEILYRPKSVLIKESGVVLYPRIGTKIVEINWEMLTDVTINERKGLLESGKDGSLAISKKKRWWMANSILYKIRDKYTEKMGRPPLDLNKRTKK